MTLVQKVAAGLIVTLFIAVAVLAAVVYWQSARIAEAGRAAEAADLAAKDATVAHDATVRQMKASLDDAAGQIKGLSDALARARKAAPGAVVTSTAVGSTGAVPVEAGRPECLLRPGDKGAIDVASAELQTKAGNRVLVQAAQASRVDPGGKVALFGGEIRADLTKYLAAPPPTTSDSKFEFGAVGVCVIGAGCGAGPMVNSPSLFDHVRVGGGVFAGKVGAGGMAQLTVRF